MSETKHDDLDKEAEHLLEEARMVLPGVQALFGFQLIAVFNNRFYKDLSYFDQRLHLAALLLAALSIALLMTPAAYHRQVEPSQISKRFNRIATRLITLALAPLALALTSYRHRQRQKYQNQTGNYFDHCCFSLREAAIKFSLRSVA